MHLITTENTFLDDTKCHFVLICAISSLFLAPGPICISRYCHCHPHFSIEWIHSQEKEQATGRCYKDIHYPDNLIISRHI